MHQSRDPQAPRPDDWGIAAELPQTVGFADTPTQLEQLSKLLRATGRQREGAWAVVNLVGAVLVAFMFVVLALAYIIE